MLPVMRGRLVILTVTLLLQAIGLRRRHPHNGSVKVPSPASPKSTMHTTGSVSVLLYLKFWTVLVLHTRYVASKLSCLSDLMVIIAGPYYLR